MAGAGISYKIEYLRINHTCPASTCGIFHTLYEPKFQVALIHRNWTGGLLPVNASSYILGASIQPLAWLCVGCSGLVKVYQACAVFLMNSERRPVVPPKNCIANWAAKVATMTVLTPTVHCYLSEQRR